MLQEQERAVLEALPREVDSAADAVLVHMKRRTGRGVGVNERQFQPYSAQYAIDEKGGRRQPVTLIRRGDMMNALQVRPEGRLKRVVRFTDRRQERKGRAHQFGTRRLPQRRWFGVTVRFARRLFTTFQANITAKLPKDRRRRFKIEINL